MADLDMERIKNIHLIGVGGCGMSGLAKILHEMGYKVSGSDSREGPNTLRLKDLGVKIHIDHNESQVREADLVVYSSAVTEKNVEMQQALAKGVPIIKRAEMLSWIINRSRIRIAVAGTHGKTTTTAMIAKVLDAAKMSPTYFIGCDMDYAEGNAKLGGGGYAVAEADESDSSFLCLSPTAAVITNIEADHMEKFGTMEAVFSAFQQFADRVSPDGFIAVDAGDPFNQKLMTTVKKRFITYALKAPAQYMAKDLSFKNFGSRYHLFKDQEELGEVELLVPGWQNVLNSLAVFAVCTECGLDFGAITSGLRTFVGARRRFQTVGEQNDILIVDDYAHHPTEIKATLSAARSGWPERRIICIFQPHRYSRTMLLKDQFAQAFVDADKVIITDVYAASEAPIPGVSGQTIAKAVKNKEVRYIKRKENISAELVKELKPGDLILTLGAGDIYTVGKELLTRLKINQ